MSAPDLFAEFLARSEAMMAAAIDQDWAALQANASQRDEIEAAIKRQHAIERRPLNDREAEVFRRVQELDREVRDRVEPWLKHAGKLLSRWGALSS